MSVCSWFPILPLCTHPPFMHASSLYALVCRSALQEMHKCSVRLSRPCWRCLPYASSAVAAARWRHGIGSAGLLPMAATIARAVCTR
ncbi:hypothetical protein V8C86DRAFT_2530111, partial [Haematococcus lacustris]